MSPAKVDFQSRANPAILTALEGPCLRVTSNLPGLDTGFHGDAGLVVLYSIATSPYFRADGNSALVVLHAHAAGAQLRANRNCGLIVVHTCSASPHSGADRNGALIVVRANAPGLDASSHFHSSRVVVDLRTPPALSFVRTETAD